MYCNKCGYELKDDDLFCSKCGNKIDYIDNFIEDLNNDDVNNTTKNETLNVESKEFTEAKKKELSKKVFKAFWVNGLTGLIVYFGFMFFWYLVNGQFSLKQCSV